MLALLLASTIAWLPGTTVYRARALEESLSIIIPDSVIGSALGSSSFTVASATLAVPGYGVVTGEVHHKLNSYRIDFDTSRIIRRIGRSRVESLEGLPTVTINFIDYKTGKVATVTISTYTEYLRREARSHHAGRGPLALVGAAARDARDDPLLLLREKAVRVDADYATILEGVGDLVVTRISLSPDLPPILRLHAISSASPCTPGPREYPYPGTGIYQKTDNSLYYNLTHENGQPYVPDWWEERFKDNPGYGETAEEAYQRFVRDLIASYYLVSKAKYPDINDAIRWLRDYIAIGQRDDARPGTDLISMEEFLRYDHWNESMEGVTLHVDLSILSFKVTHELKTTDAKKHTYSVTITVSNGMWKSGMLIACFPLVAVEHPVVQQRQYQIFQTPISFYNTSARFGAVIARNTTLTFGPDYIMIFWKIDASTCPNYYIIRPIAFISPIYTVSYNLSSIVKHYSPDGDPLGNASSVVWTRYLYSQVNKTSAGTDPSIDHEVLYWETYTYNGSSGPNVTYRPLINIPPTIHAIITLMLGQIEDPVGPVLSAAYAVVASTGSFITNVKTTSVSIDFAIVQDTGLSKEASLTIVGYEAGARHAFGDSFYPVFLYIDAHYSNNRSTG